MAQEGKVTTTLSECTSSETPSQALTTSLAISTNDRWFNQLPVVTTRSQFTSHNIYLWARHIQAILRPRNLLDHLTSEAPPGKDPRYKQWVVEAEILYIWILDYMNTEMANRFIQYETVNEIWDVVHKYHLKKNDRSKIAQLVNEASVLQQGERSILGYVHELTTIFSEIHHNRPPVHST